MFMQICLVSTLVVVLNTSQFLPSTSVAVMIIPTPRGTLMLHALCAVN